MVIQDKLFDILVLGTLFINVLQDDFQKQMFFVFYSLFLFCLSLGKKEIRGYRSLPLALLLVWSLVGVFIHSFDVRLNVAMHLFEGFIYIFAGVLLLQTCIKHMKSIWLIWCFIPILLVPWRRPGPPNHTLLCSVALAIIIYLFLKRRYILGVLGTSIFTVVSVVTYPILSKYFACRIPIFDNLLHQIVQHPFVGTGFNKTLSYDNMVFHPYWGWLYRHNDYLSIGAFIGVASTLLIIAFIVSSLKRIRTSIYLIPFLIIVIMCMFQMTMFKVDKAISCILITSLCLAQTTREVGDV